MFDKLKGKLEALDCGAWELCEEKKHGWEFYFIRHSLDQNRAVNVLTYTVKLFMNSENGEFLGSASAEIPPTASDAEIDKILSDLKYQASLVKNPAYTLTSAPVHIPEKLEPADIEKIAGDFIRAIRSVPETETEDINSYEIFVNEITRRTLNSNGVAYTCTYPSSMAEVVVNARRDGHEIELYRNYRSGSCDAQKLRNDISETLRYGKDRLAAVPTPKLERYDVVFSTDDAVSIFSYFADKMNAGMKFRKLSSWETGKPICEDAVGDKISVYAVSSLENSSWDFPVDEEGCVICDKPIIKDSIAENFWGNRQFSQYLGLENSSNVYNFRFEGGEKSEREIRSGDYMEVVEFSDFQVDELTGDIAGEIRLAYLHRGGEVKVVTGGSVSGNMNEAVRDMTFSKELKQYNCYVIPAAVKLKNLRITGAE